MLRIHYNISLMKGSGRNIARNILGGLLIGYGWAGLIVFFALEHHFAAHAPAKPNYPAGLIWQHDDHGWISYFSAFQATACALLFSTSLPLAFLGALIAPRRDIVMRRSKWSFRFNWQQDDPDKILKYAVALGAIAAGPMLYLLGPVIVRAVNAAGIVLQF